jgi:hypothetical protein
MTIDDLLPLLPHDYMTHKKLAVFDPNTEPQKPIVMHGRASSVLK